MKNSHKIILGTILFSMIFSISALSNVLALGVTINSSQDLPYTTDIQTSAVEVVLDGSQENQYETQVEAHNRTTFRYQHQTQLTINCSVDCDLTLSCESLKIGAKAFEIEIEGTGDLEMNMTCTEEQAELGLLLGERYTARNQNRFLYQEAFCVSLQANTSFIQAKLMIQASAQNAGGSWAYYDDSANVWVTVPTTIEDGYLVTTTDHFSYWTILIPESDLLFYIAIIAIIVGIIAAVSIVGIVIYMKKR